MIWEIKYMIDPGDGIVSTETIEHATDIIEDVIAGWRDQGDECHDPLFIVSVSCLGDDSE